ncbi:hypothetical protein [Saccharopolyspora elongata]|uniref:hypothetical protein n=1 Tax=Saccharopolyspora elongata TaxID=2530387 RepID=UPI00140442B4|nr:hypothetical protein [Saccharopolyspora elongata]
MLNPEVLLFHQITVQPYVSTGAYETSTAHRSPSGRRSKTLAWRRTTCGRSPVARR